MESKLVLVRHGQSVWNKKNLFTGWKDVDLTELGVDEANRAGVVLKNEAINFDIAFTSELIRAQRTLKIILAEIDQAKLETNKNIALNERDYGDLTGMNKDDAREKFGEEQVHIWRRSYDVPPPGGESLELTAKRVLPYYKSDIIPLIKEGKNIIVAAHGNSLRSLAMDIEGLTKEEVLSLEIATGVPIIYDLDENLNILHKKILKI